MSTKEPDYTRSGGRLRVPTAAELNADGLKFDAERYLPPSRFVDQSMLSDLPVYRTRAGETSTQDKCLRCGDSKNRSHSEWSTCRRQCCMCGDDEDDGHLGRMCPRIYWSIAFHKKKSRDNSIPAGLQLCPSAEEQKIMHRTRYKETFRHFPPGENETVVRAPAGFTSFRPYAAEAEHQQAPPKRPREQSPSSPVSCKKQKDLTPSEQAPQPGVEQELRDQLRQIQERLSRCQQDLGAARNRADMAESLLRRNGISPQSQYDYQSPPRRNHPAGPWGASSQPLGRRGPQSGAFSADSQPVDRRGAPSGASSADFQPVGRRGTPYGASSADFQPITNLGLALSTPRAAQFGSEPWRGSDGQDRIKAEPEEESGRRSGGYSRDDRIKDESEEKSGRRSGGYARDRIRDESEEPGRWSRSNARAFIKREPEESGEESGRRSGGYSRDRIRDESEKSGRWSGSHTRAFIKREPEDSR
ncbi:hypothetical protein BDV95DRAFT_595129 [Massariosphaeria phaeospora]|uniref:Uncharacterized protein n=1 Tax=Massariosphaeria phaeospora TaxID=100035 RepID=A0A7C8M9E2_9PLEO|nr:hypothetical protein BDV95DRAFT_595129 [Massariosphaeria phaeospora]